jgi:hypothetical protein
MNNESKITTSQTKVKVISSSDPEKAANQAAIPIAFNSGMTVNVVQMGDTRNWNITNWDNKVIAIFLHEDDVYQNVA